MHECHQEGDSKCTAITRLCDRLFKKMGDTLVQEGNCQYSVSGTIRTTVTGKAWSKKTQCEESC